MSHYLFDDRHGETVLNAPSDGDTLVPGTLRGYRLWNTSWRTTYAYGCRLGGCCPAPEDPVCRHCAGKDPACTWNQEYLLSSSAGCGEGERSCGLRAAAIRPWIWRPQGDVARCTSFGAWPFQMMLPSQPDDHLSPVRTCSCGYYGWYRPQETFEYYNLPVFGCFQAWGRITLGTLGFRAQHVRVEAIASAEPEVVARLKVVYPQVSVFASPAALVEQFPAQEVASLGVSLPERACTGCPVCSEVAAAGWSVNGVAQVRAAVAAGAMGCLRRTEDAQRAPLTREQMRAAFSGRPYALLTSPSFSAGRTLAWGSPAVATWSF